MAPHPTNRNIDQKTTLVFLGLAFGLSWGMTGAYLGLGGPLRAPWIILLGVGFMAGPLMAAVIAQRWAARGPLKGPLALSWRLNRWWLVAWLAPVGLALAVTGASLLVPGVTLDWEMTHFLERMRASMSPEDYQTMLHRQRELPLHPLWLALLQGLVAGPTVNALFGWFEEAGWRGLLFHLWRPMGFWNAQAAIGMVWGLWHAPMVLWMGANYPQHPVSGVLLMTVFTILLAPLIGYIRLRSGSSIAAGVFHGSINAMGGVPLVVLSGGSDLSVGLTGAAGLMVLALAVGLLAWFDPHPTESQTLR
ncbi:MAG: CPBP family intramembrane metalloprotease [Deltaproteobacteria bacterium]|nr:CPBP family intramembrane metalloprotease [Deltaproteobacteria bacterium]